MNTYKRNISEYYKEAGRLSMLQHGAYTLLIDACYEKQYFPTLDDAYNWCWASTDEERAAVQFVLTKFFVLTVSVYIHPGIKAEIDKKGQATTKKTGSTILPDDFQVKDDHFKIAQERGINVYDALEQMRDWSLSGNNKKVDWDATFRNWLRRTKVEQRNWRDDLKHTADLLT